MDKNLKYAIYIYTVCIHVLCNAKSLCTNYCTVLYVNCSVCLVHSLLYFVTSAVVAASINQIVNPSNTVNEGGFFSITCQASGNPSPTNKSYTWINKDGQLKIGSVLNFTSISSGV